VEREDEVGLLDDLLAVELELGEVQEQRVAVDGSSGEVPPLVLSKAFRLWVHTELRVPRQEHLARGGLPGGGLFTVGAELRALLRVASSGVGGGEQVLLCQRRLLATYRRLRRRPLGSRDTRRSCG
jgi:hypothetical protein